MSYSKLSTLCSIATMICIVVAIPLFYMGFKEIAEVLAIIAVISASACIITFAKSAQE